MTRGRKPKEAIRSAIRIAEKRGEVDLVRFRPGMIATLIIYCAGFVVHVRIKRMRHIRCSEQALEREAADDLAALRLIAESLQISRELWICSPRGNFRFFRACEDMLIEMDRDGQPLPVQWPVRRRRKAPAVPAPAGESGDVPADTEPEAAQDGTAESPADGLSEGRESPTSDRTSGLEEENAASRQTCGRRRTLSFSRVPQTLRHPTGHQAWRRRRVPRTLRHPTGHQAWRRRMQPVGRRAAGEGRDPFPESSGLSDGEHTRSECTVRMRGGRVNRAPFSKRGPFRPILKSPKISGTRKSAEFAENGCEFTFFKPITGPVPVFHAGCKKCPNRPYWTAKVSHSWAGGG